jgi:tyrosyl-tRNA synthetase
MFQFFINQNDSDVEKLLKFMTFFNKEEIETIMTTHKQNLKERFAQFKLAEAVITDIHGGDVFAKCSNTSKTLFAKDLSTLSNDELLEALQHTNKFHAKNTQYNIIDLLFESGMVKSKSLARQLISSKSITVDHKLVEDINTIIHKENSFNKHFSYIKKGKKDYCVII